MAGRADPDADLETLIARAQEGDARAFEALVTAHLGAVRRFARAFATSEADADDLAQEALLKVYRSVRSYRYQAAFTTWLFAVVRNAMVDHARSRAGKARALEVALQPEHVEREAEAGAADERLAAEEDRRRLWGHLRQVALEFRTALVLYDVEGRTYDEIAAVEGVPVGTVKSRISRGRAQLRQLLEEERRREAGTGGGRATSYLTRSGS